MRAVVQRVHRARVEVGGTVTGQIERGLVAFVGARAGDEDADLDYVVRKVTELRVFEDERGKMARSVSDVGGGLLVVSQFTLFGDTSRGNRPSFTAAMEPERARATLERFVAACRARGLPVATGQFGADMTVLVENDGPVTILIDSRAR